MTDNSAVATYSGTGITVAGWKQAVEGTHDPSPAEMTAWQDGELSLMDGTGQCESATATRGEKVPNFSPTHVVTPVPKRGIPAGAASSPLARSQSTAK